MELVDALAFARPRRNGVLTTQRANGRPQLSNISYHLGDNGKVRISVTATRAKTKNLMRTPAASLYVAGDDFWEFVVIDADAELSAVAQSPDDAATDALVDLYRSIVGEHPDWQEYREAMVADQRLVITLHPTHAYGQRR
jgi:PPOX class probable F420-dependent enzyme